MSLTSITMVSVGSGKIGLEVSVWMEKVDRNLMTPKLHFMDIGYPPFFKAT